MHPVIIENLEEYLSGALLPAVLRDFEAHLQTCPACRDEVRGMQDVSTLFAELRPVEAIQPPPAFVAQVMERAALSRAPSFWSLFSLDPGFGRRVVFASLLTLAVLGSYLVSRETEYVTPPTPEAVMAMDQSPAAPGPRGDRAMMLVTLTAYEP
jgi:anti-sigma factor RsiW